MEFVQIDFKGLRKELGLSQPAIAEKLGMKTAMWQKLESGRTPDPRASTIVHICRTLGVSADELLGLSKDESEKDAR